MEKTLGFRLRVERQRLDVSQEVFAEWGGVKKLTQVQYEHDKTSPDVRYLLALRARGVDLVYLLDLDGAKPGVLSTRKRVLLGQYEDADDRGKELIEGVAELAAQPKKDAKAGKP